MRIQTTSSLHFQRKISEFCDIRIAPHVSESDLDNIKPYLIRLIIYRKYPPMRAGRIAWQAVSDACSLENEMTVVLRKNLQLGLEAIMRWINKDRSKGNDRAEPVETTRRQANASYVTAARTNKSSPKPRASAAPPRKAKARAAPVRLIRGAGD